MVEWKSLFMGIITNIQLQSLAEAITGTSIGNASIAESSVRSFAMQRTLFLQNYSKQIVSAG